MNAAPGNQFAAVTIGSPAPWLIEAAAEAGFHIQDFYTGEKKVLPALNCQALCLRPPDALMALAGWV